MKKSVIRIILATGLLLGGISTGAAEVAKSLQRDGWVNHETGHNFKDLYERLKGAIKSNGMGHITTASASAGAKGRGITIPGNRIVGVYRNDFAVRMLEASVAAGIEAPIRYYLTENTDGTATLSYRTPTTVFAPYFEEGGDDLRKMAAELDQIFAKIAADTIGN